jgi:hypothetical protein
MDAEKSDEKNSWYAITDMLPHLTEILPCTDPLILRLSYACNRADNILYRVFIIVVSA